MAANGRLDAMTALVTGGASGIGCAVASRLIAEGGLVTLWDVDQAKLDAAQAKFGPKVRAKRVDITNAEEVERAAKDADAAMGHIDILVCSAGVAGLNADVVDYPIDEWKRVFDVNINGLFYCNRSVGSLMKARGYGRIVNVASVAGKEGNPRASAYSASKAAVIGFTKSLGKELAKDGVTVNAVAPAVIETPMLGKVDAAHVAYMRSSVDFHTYYEVVSDLIGIVHMQAGNMIGLGGQEVRLLDDFKMGPNLVRGFQPAGIGPRDLTPGTTGDALGGTLYWGASVELQYPFFFLPKDSGLRGAVFVDAGSVWDYKGETSSPATGATSWSKATATIPSRR